MEENESSSTLEASAQGWNLQGSIKRGTWSGAMFSF